VSFEAAWLDLREPADAAARDPGLLAAAAAHLGEAPAPVALDLGCGTGATARAFGTRVAGLRWRLLDRDAGLLRLAAARVPGAELVAADLAALERLPLEGVRLVTASALFDLVSRAWVEALAARLAAAGLGLYAALSYDGRLAWQPALAADEAGRAAFNRHQRTDKGFGPALGSDAGAALAEAFGARGYAVRTARSDWRLGPGALQAALADGVAAAAAAAGCAGASAWGQARRAASGSGSCTVGHIDVLALPAGARAQSKTTSESRP
jgi:SAM-dependent methyltransferase